MNAHTWRRPAAGAVSFIRRSGFSRSRLSPMLTCVGWLDQYP
jgi:hypothetical protein